MKKLIFALLFSTSLYAGELSPRIFEIIGSYESEAARTADSSMANDFSSFNVLITPDSEAMVHFDEWEETYEFKFVGAFPGQLPAFKPTQVHQTLAATLSACSPLIKGTFLKCATAGQFKFEQAINENGLNKLSDYLGASFNTKLSKEQAITLISKQYENLLLQTKIFSFKSEETEQYKALEQNIQELLTLIQNEEIDSVLSSLNRTNSWRYSTSIDFLFVKTQTNEVIRFKLEF